MAHAVLFHHVLGITRGIENFAAQLRAAGHTVTVPDLFAGKQFTELSQGLAHANKLGDAELLARAQRDLQDGPADSVYVGFSLGVGLAQQLLQTRTGAAGAIFLHAFIAPDALPGTWPNDCPVGVFAMDKDPFFVDDGDYAAALAWQEGHPNLSIKLYPGSGHLFMEPALPDYDAKTTATVTGDLLELLARIDAQRA